MDEHKVICVGNQGGRNVCRGGTPGQCPSDMRECNAEEMNDTTPADPNCFDKGCPVSGVCKKSKKCERKKAKGKCKKMKIATKKCRKTCGTCHLYDP